MFSARTCSIFSNDKAQIKQQNTKRKHPLIVYFLHSSWVIRCLQSRDSGFQEVLAVFTNLDIINIQTFRMFTKKTIQSISEIAMRIYVGSLQHPPFLKVSLNIDPLDTTWTPNQSFHDYWMSLAQAAAFSSGFCSFTSTEGMPGGSPRSIGVAPDAVAVGSPDQSQKRSSIQSRRR